MAWPARWRLPQGFHHSTGICLSHLAPAVNVAVVCTTFWPLARRWGRRRRWQIFRAKGVALFKGLARWQWRHDDHDGWWTYMENCGTFGFLQEMGVPKNRPFNEQSMRNRRILMGCRFSHTDGQPRDAGGNLPHPLHWKPHSPASGVRHHSHHRMMIF